MPKLVCYSCGAAYYSAASIERLYGALTCENDGCNAPLFQALDLGSAPKPAAQLELTDPASGPHAAR